MERALVAPPRGCTRRDVLGGRVRRILRTARRSLRPLGAPRVAGGAARTGGGHPGGEGAARAGTDRARPVRGGGGAGRRLLRRGRRRRGADCVGAPAPGGGGAVPG